MSDIWGLVFGLFVGALIIGLYIGGHELSWRRRSRSGRAQALDQHPGYDEKVLLGPVSAWVAEGEARAVREWREQHGLRPPPPRGAGAASPRPNRMLVLGPGVEYIPLHLDHRVATEAAHDLLNRHDPDLPWPMREAEWR